MSRARRGALTAPPAVGPPRAPLAPRRYGHRGSARSVPTEPSAARAPVAATHRPAARVRVAPRPPGLQRRRARRAPGPATPNESREASGREYPSARAAASVAPVRETPGDERRGLGERRARAHAERRAERARGRLRAAVGRARARRRRASSPPRAPAARRGAPRSWRSNSEPDEHRRRAATARACAASGPQPPGAPAPARASAPACSATSSSLRRCGGPLRHVPAEQPRHRGDVRGRGDRQQLGRALDQPERGDLRELRRHRRIGADAVAAPLAGSAGTATRRRRRSPR